MLDCLFDLGVGLNCHEGYGEPATGSGQKWERKANGWSGKETKLVNWSLDCLFDLGVGHFGTR